MRFAALLSLAIPSLSLADTLTVPGDHANIADAIAAAADGDTIEIGTGTWAELLAVDATFATTGLTLAAAPGAAGTVIVGGAAGGDATVVIDGGKLAAVGLIFEAADLRSLHATNGADLDLTDVTVRDGSAVAVGVGLLAEVGATITVTGSTFDNNAATGGVRGGNVFALDSTLTFTDSTISNGSGSAGGGVRLARSVFTASGCGSGSTTATA